MCGRCLQSQNERRGRKLRNWRYWDHATCLTAGHVWYERTGYLPQRIDWFVVGPHSNFPSRSTIQRLFGTWQAFEDALIERVKQRERQQWRRGVLRNLHERRERHERRGILRGLRERHEARLLREAA